MSHVTELHILFCLVLILYLFSLVWQSLSSEVILENSKLPEGMTLAYTSRCKNGLVSEGENGRKCSNISIGDEVSTASIISLCYCMKIIVLHSTQLPRLLSYISYFLKHVVSILF